MKRFVKGAIASFLALTRITYRPLQGSNTWQNLQKFITKSYIVKKICLKLYPCLNLVYYATKFLAILISKQILPQCYLWLSEGFYLF